MSAACKKLVVRAEPNDDESFGGYVIRLTELNHYDTPSTVLKLAGIDPKFLSGGYSLLFLNSFDPLPLSQVTESDVAKIGQLAYAPTGHDSRANASIFGRPVNKNFIRVRYAKVCPTCLKNSPYCRRIWDLNPVTACPFHRILLVDECPGCRKRINSWRSGVTRCRCDFDFRTAKVTPVQPSDVEFARRIYQLCGALSPNGTTGRPSDSPVLSLDLEHLLRVVYFVARQYRRDVHRNGGYFSSFGNSELHGLLTLSFSVFTDWPSNLHNFLDQVRAQNNADAYFKGLTNDFGSFYRNLYVNAPSDKFDFLREEFEEFVYQKWYGSWAFGRNRLKDKSPRGRRYISKAEAMRQLGLHVRCINRLIKLGKLKTKENRPGARVGALIEAEDVTKFKIALKHSLTLADAARLLGVRDARVIELVRRGHIEALRGPGVDGSQAWRFSRESVDGLLKQIYRECLPVGSIERTMLVDFRMVLTMFVGCDFDTSRLITAITEKKITPYRTDGSADMSGLSFCRIQVYEYARALRRERRGGYYCVKDLTKELGFTTTIPIFYLIHSGLIKGKKRAGSLSREWLVSEEEVNSFRSKYVLASHLARETGTSGPCISQVLMSRGISPVSGPGVDRGKQYVFRRADVENLDLAALLSEARLQEKRKNKKLEIVDSDEVCKILGITSRELSQLVDRGVLDPSSTKQRDAKAGHLFNLFHVERLKASSVDHLNLISLSNAAKMLGETYCALRTNWLNSGHLKIVCRYNDKLYLALSDVRTTLKLKEHTLTVTGAANTLGVSVKTLMGFVSSGKLKLVHKSSKEDAGRNLLLRREVDKLRSIMLQPT